MTAEQEPIPDLVLDARTNRESTHPVWPANTIAHTLRVPMIRGWSRVDGGVGGDDQAGWGGAGRAPT